METVVTEMVALATLALAAVATPAALVTAACLGRRRHGRLSRRNRRRRSTHLRHTGHHGLWGAVLQSGRRFLLWLYWDPECGKGISSWLIDNEAPSTTAVSDLDGDGSCSIILCVPKIQRLVLASTGPRHVANILQLRASVWTGTDVTISQLALPLPPSPAVPTSSTSPSSPPLP